jgi:TGS domain
MKKQKKEAAASGDDGDVMKGQNLYFNDPARLLLDVNEMTPSSAYIDYRIKLYDALRAQYLDELKTKPRNKISITLPDGKVVEGLSWETTPYQVASGTSQGLADNNVIAKVGSEL